MSPLTYEVGRRLIKIKHAGLTNIVAGKEVAREFIQAAATPDNLSREILRLLDEPDYAQQMRLELEKVGQLMGEQGCSLKVASMVADMSDKSMIDGLD